MPKRRRSARVAEERLVKLLEERGMKAFIVVPSAEAQPIDYAALRRASRRSATASESPDA